MYNIVVSVRAEKHVNAAYDWYEQQREGLGDEFLSVVEVALFSIQAHPLLYGFRSKKVRGCIVKGFPYIILFYVRGANIRVVAVFHMSKKS